MNQENITVTLTASEHELVNEALLQFQNCFDVVYSYSEDHNTELYNKIKEISSLRTKIMQHWIEWFDEETVLEASPEPPQAPQVPYDEPVNQPHPMTSQLTPEALEALAEDAEDFLNDRDIELTSHSYENIIAQAQQHGFKV